LLHPFENGFNTDKIKTIHIKLRLSAKYVSIFHYITPIAACQEKIYTCAIASTRVLCYNEIKYRVNTTRKESILCFWII
jgi:hypothetical protein